MPTGPASALTRRAALSLFGGACLAARSALHAQPAGGSAATASAPAPTPPPASSAPAPAAPRVFCLSRSGLAAARALVARDDPAVRPSLARLRREATLALDVGPYSVVLKSAVPPSGNKHDYQSLAPYAWPDPDKPGGLPYKGRDGLTNPEWWQDYDRVPLERLAQAAEVLAAMYHFTGDAASARRAAHLLRVWFLDPATAMTPDLLYAQAVPGRHPGRPHAIDTRFLTRVIDSVGLLGGSPAWTDRDQAGLVAWFRTFVANQQRRMDEGYRTAAHNIASFYQAQIAAQALFVGDLDLARTMLARTRDRLAAAVGPDGFFTVERNRTRSFSYSCFHLFALFNLAAMGTHAGVDLWHFATPDGRSLRRALDAVAAHAGSYPPPHWPFAESGHTPGDWWDPAHDQLPVVLFHAAQVYHEPAYLSAAEKILAPRGGLDAHRLLLLGGFPLLGQQSLDGWLFRPASAG